MTKQYIYVYSIFCLSIGKVCHFACQSEKFVIYTIVFGSTKIDFQKIIFSFGVFSVTKNVGLPKIVF